MRDFRSDRSNNNRPQRDYAGQSRSANTQAINAVFREPLHQVLEKIEPFFKWPNKMARDPMRHNQKPLLLIPSRQGTLYEGLQELVGLFGPAGPRRKIGATVAPFQSPGKASWFESLERFFFKTSSRNDQCHLRYSGENWLLSLQSDVYRSVTRQGLQFEAKKGQVRCPVGSGLLE